MIDNKDLQVFEKTVVRLPETAGQVFEYVRDHLLEKTRELSKEIGSYSEICERINITSKAELEEAVSMLQHRKKIVALVDAELAEINDKAHKLHKGVRAAISVLMDPLDQTEKDLKKKIVAYQKAEQEKAESEERRLRDEATKRHQAELSKARTKLMAIAAKVSDMAGHIAALEEELKRPDITAEEHEVVSMELQTLIAKRDGLTARAQEIVERPAPLSAPVVAPDTKVDGLSSGSVWEVEVVDAMKLIEAVHLRIVPVEVLSVNMTKLRKLVQAGGSPQSRALDGTPGVPGCRVTKGLSIRITGGSR